MSMAFRQALKGDLLFQNRSGIHVIYVVLTLLYTIVISLLPDALANVAGPLLIYTDPSVLGFFFIGALLMLEKQQGILRLLTVVPMDMKEYLLAKVASLALVALVSSLVICIAGGLRVNYLLFIPSLLLTTSFFTLAGFMTGLWCQTVNQYFGRVVPGMFLIIIPVAALLSPTYKWLAMVLPSVASANLFVCSFSGGGFKEIAYGLGMMIFWNGLIWRWTLVRFDRYLSEGGD